MLAKYGKQPVVKNPLLLGKVELVVAQLDLVAGIRIGSHRISPSQPGADRRPRSVDDESMSQCR
jgi:hypothetical protein